MGRGIIHRKLQTNRAREIGAPDHQQAGIGSMALGSIHRDNPEAAIAMLTPPPKLVSEEMVQIPRSAFDELVSRVAALEAGAVHTELPSAQENTDSN